MDLKLNYKPVYAAEKFGSSHSFGIQIMLAVERELTEEERIAIYRLVDGVEDIVQRASEAYPPLEMVLFARLSLALATQLRRADLDVRALKEL